MTRQVDAALIEQRRRKQIEWWANLTPAERDALKAKREAGMRRYREGKARLAEKEQAR